MDKLCQSIADRALKYILNIVVWTFKKIVNILEKLYTTSIIVQNQK